MTTLLESKLNIIKSSYVPVAGDKSKVIAKNYLYNPNFETDITTWVAAVGAILTRDTLTTYSGAASLKVVTPGVAINEGTYHNPIVPKGLNPGEKVSGHVRVNAPLNATLEIWVNCLGAGSIGRLVNYTGTGNWDLVQVNGSILGDNTQTYVIVRTRSTLQAITFYVDNAFITSGDSFVNYFDGSSSGAYWEGAANASPSYLTDLSNTSADDLLFNYWANKSGLTPRDSFSMDDHVRAAGSHDFIKDVT